MMTTLRLPKVAGVCIIQSLDDVVDMHAISPSEVYLASGLSKKSYDTECPSYLMELVRLLSSIFSQFTI